MKEERIGLDIARSINHKHTLGPSPQRKTARHLQRPDRSFFPITPHDGYGMGSEE
jgi:hypothetical protein